MPLRNFLSHYGTPNHFPDCAGTYKGGVVICADAACVWDDLKRCGCRSGNGLAKDGWDFFTVNRLIETFPGRVEHCYSNNGTVLQRFVVARRQEYHDEFGFTGYTHACTPGAYWTWPWSCHGTSGLGAILTALALGYERIVLCGMPLDSSGHNGEPPWRKCRFETEVPDNDQHWERAIKYGFDGKVTSMSGRTREWLGQPSSI